MAKKKSAATVLASNGSELVPLVDLRFEEGDWPITFDVPAVNADAWLASLFAECEARGWICSQLAQVDRERTAGASP